MSIKHQLFYYLIITLLLSSCHRNRKPQNTLNYQQWRNVTSWAFTGKMAINDGQNSGSGKVNWINKKNLNVAKFKAPLGHGSWEIIESPKQAKLISSSSGERTALNAQILLNREIGWDFPWNKLSNWFRGYTDEKVLLTHTILPTTLFHDGWEITYEKWTNTSVGWLPKKIKASKPPHSVKLFIYEWVIN